MTTYRQLDEAIERERAVLLIERWQHLADAGLIVSICHGPGMGRAKRSWSVMLGHRDTGLTNITPFQAIDFAHCIEIADREAQKLVRAASVLQRANDDA